MVDKINRLGKLSIGEYILPNILVTWRTKVGGDGEHAGWCGECRNQLNYSFSKPNRTAMKLK